MRGLPWVGLVLLASCSEPEGQVRYSEFVLYKDHSIRRTKVKSETTTVVEEPHVRYRIFQILDAHGRRCDTLWILNDMVFDWNQYKLLVKTPVGGISLHQRFSPDSPGGNPWDEFVVDRDGDTESIGETGRSLERGPADAAVEQVHLLYHYENGGLVSASYDGSGKWVQFAAQLDGHASFDYPPGHGDFAVCKFPETIDVRAWKPTVSEGLRNGPGKLIEHHALSSPLSRVYVVRQFEIGRLFHVVAYNNDLARLEEQWVRFAPRPYDEAIRKAYRAAK